MPDAARISDMHMCPKVEPGPVPHVGGPIFSGSANVIIGHMPAARVGDSVVCIPIGSTDKISEGSSTVIINYRAAARRTDPCTHIQGSKIVGGCPTVIIGDSPQSFTFRAAARRGTPFCEECERRRREREEAQQQDDSPPKDPNSVTLDDDPPPGASTGRDELGFHSVEEVAAASSIPGNDDGLAGRDARVALAWKFLVGKAGGRIKPSDVHKHINGIDLSRPVEVVPIAGETLFQRSFPGADNGAYFTPDCDATPSQLGVSLTVYRRFHGVTVPPPLPLELREVRFTDAPAYGLRSTAAPIVDTWSLEGSDAAPAAVVPCEGGATQVMIPKSHQGATTTRKI